VVPVHHNYSSLLVGMQVALKYSGALVKIGFFCLIVTVIQQLFHLRNGAFWLGSSWHFAENSY